jgi:uncharacterized zinc-type alcohol dehydrogenase-like protein
VTTTVSAYAADSATTPLAKTTITRRAVGPHDVALDIHYAGICHTDIHIAKSEWGPSSYPVVPGHEIAGIVTQVGAEVTKHRVGDRVGVGCFVDSCRECDNCHAGMEQHCTGSGMVLTYGGVDRDGEPTQGGYSGAIVVDENYVLAIPDGIPLDAGAPLLCAGVTVYSPLRRHGVNAGSRIAVIGLGGLGHLAVQFAKAMGAEITVLSQSLKKREDGLRLGADSYYATNDPDTFTALAGTFDLIVNTVSAELNLDDYFGLLRTGGTLVELGMPSHPLQVPAFPLAAGQLSVTGSLMGGIAETQEMLDFAAQHGITTEIEVITPDYVNQAYERVLASDVRYRFVINTETLR